jgi:signal transduction histidine kinase
MLKLMLRLGGAGVLGAVWLRQTWNVPRVASGCVENFLPMVSHTTPKTKIAGTLGGLGLLAVVGYADFLTGYQIGLLPFYLLPILVVFRYAGLVAACVMAVLAAAIWLLVDIAAGHRYSSHFIPVWNAGACLAIFLLVIVLVYSRRHVQELVDKRTESLQKQIRERIRLEQELLAVAEMEQQRIGQDLHDSLGQHLTATAMAGKVLSSRIAKRAAVEPDMADHVVAMVEEAIELTRSLARSLHPIAMEEEGPGHALEHLAASLSQAFGVSCQFQQTGSILLPDSKAAVYLYRIAQEASNNSIRHGRARNILISLEATNETLVLMVTDDGTGLPPNALNKEGLGLRIMKYRARLIGADFDIQNLSGGGARAVCVLNFRRKDDAAHAA